MNIKSFLSLPFANYIVFKNKKWKYNAIHYQSKIFNHLINSGKNTVFGKDHGFSSIKTYSEFKKRVPVRSYEELSKYISRVIDGEKNVLWPKKPIYFCKTSGTTSGSKYIPITKESMPNHITAARDAILSYISETRNTSIVEGKMIFLQGSPVLDKTGDILTGRLSGIVAHHAILPNKKQLPSFKTNCIDDWELKVDEIVNETIDEKMSLISAFLLGFKCILKT